MLGFKKNIYEEFGRIYWDLEQLEKKYTFDVSIGNKTSLINELENIKIRVDRMTQQIMEHHFNKVDNKEKFNLSLFKNNYEKFGFLYCELEQIKREQAYYKYNEEKSKYLSDLMDKKIDEYFILTKEIKKIIN